MHRGPQAHAQPFALQSAAGPNAALLIDFDNVTLGIQKDLGKELRNLLGSDIIKGKVSVQRAYADWRRYPQYIVPLAESSIDMIFAPAYGSAKKNATDIRLAIDAIELVFTRPEIGTFILLSGDSDFSSLVLKLKEYGKYVIGVGIRESASDLLVQNCDEYYSYNALAGLSKSADEAPVKRDPWELVADAILKMKRQGDVMRSDRLKQVMQELDPSFDEKDLGYSKFSRFVTEAASKGLVVLTKLENGQLEVSPPGGEPASGGATATGEGREPREEREEREGRGRRSRRGRGRGRDRADGAPRVEGVAADPADATDAAEAVTAERRPSAPTPSDDIGLSGERLTRDEALALVRRAVEAIVTGDDAVSSEAVRRKARELHGRDSESLALRFFDRILKDAHTGGHIDLRRRGDAFEVARIADAPVADQLAAAAQANAPVVPAAPAAPRGLG
ncbi:MAG: NYN domain-containing protein, partial [Gemmatimonadota bacterium]